MKEINAQDILAGNIRSLSKAITLAESNKPEHQDLARELIEKLLPSTGKSKRIGISGTPGVGKSSFIEKLGLFLVSKGHKVAVLAIDPSSPVSGGSILGDKTRMEKLSQEANAYIRPSPTAGTLGGIAQKTREAMLLCEAAGFDIILIETVGVGQSEFAVSDMVDMFTVLLLPGGGDELQGIKKGIIEIANYILINKADGENKQKAMTTMSEYQSALNIVSKENFWKTRIECVSALDGQGIEKYWEGVLEFFSKADITNQVQARRQAQNKKWFKNLFFDLLKSKIQNDGNLQREWNNFEEIISQNKSTPIICANKMIDMFLNK